MSERPGIMFYFDKWEPLADLQDKDLAALVRAAIKYAHYGIVPEFTGTLCILWEILKGPIDRDGERYNETISSRRFATYCREEKKHGREPLTFGEWKAICASNDIERYPTISTSATPTPTAAAAEPQPQTEPQPQPQPKIESERGSGKNGSAGGEEPQGENKWQKQKEQRMAMLDNYQ